MTPAPRSLPRRTVLAASGTAVLAAAAACSSTPTASTPSTTAAATSSAAGSIKSEASSAANSVEVEASSVAGSAAADPTTAATSEAAAPTGTPLASVADVESAGAIIVGQDQDSILLAATEGTVVAHTAVCTHQGCIIQSSGECNCHHSRFNITTGAVENPPAQQPLAEIAVIVSGGQVYRA